MVAAATVLLALGSAALVERFVAPDDDPVLADGPFVVLGGGSGERLAAALELRAGDEARPLVLSWGAADRWRATGGSCADRGVRCIAPAPVDTRGEARAIAELARREGWRSVTVVTSRFHVPRSRWLFTHCVPAQVAVVGADVSGQAGRVSFRHAVEEALATGASMLLHRAC